jgi:plasmid stabilization system protein ParE
MGYQVAFSPSARRDLRDIVRYISLDSPERAVTLGQFLVSSTKRLAELLIEHAEDGLRPPQATVRLIGAEYSHAPTRCS